MSKEFLTETLRVNTIKYTSETPDLTFKAGPGGVLELISEGRVKLTGTQIDVSSKNIINVATPTESHHAANKAYVDSQNLTSPIWSKHVVSFEDFSIFSGLNEGSVVLLQLAPKQVIHSVIIKNETEFTGVGQYNLSIGVVGDLEKYTSAFEVSQAPNKKYFQASNSLSPEDFTDSVDLVITATSFDGTLDAANLGEASIYLLTSILPV